MNAHGLRQHMTDTYDVEAVDVDRMSDTEIIAVAADLGISLDAYPEPDAEDLISLTDSGESPMFGPCVECDSVIDDDFEYCPHCGHLNLNSPHNAR